MCHFKNKCTFKTSHYIKTIISTGSFELEVKLLTSLQFFAVSHEMERECRSLSNSCV